MQLRHLLTFVTISESLTLTEAAGKLHKTQGAVSHDLKSLEQELGVRLVNRSGQRARLTQAGRYLLPHARELLQRTQDLQRTMREVGEAGHPEVRVGVLPSLADTSIEHVESFRRQNPHVTFSVIGALRRELLAGLRDGRLDLVVVDAEVDEGTVSEEVGVEPIGIVIHHALGRGLREPVRASVLEDVPFLAFSRELGTTPGADEFFRNAGRYPPTAVVVSDQHLMRAFIRAQAGYGIMPLAAAVDDDQLLRLRTDPALERRVVVLRSERRLLSPTASRFYDHIVNTWRETETNRRKRRRSRA